MTAVTLTAGNYVSAYFGYARSGNGLGLPAFGSISGQPLAGQTIDALLTGAANLLTLAGDTTALGPLTLTVNGVNWPTSLDSYNAGANITGYTITPSGGGFSDGVAYTVDLTTDGGSDNTPPTITSASSASVAENTQLAHALTANETVTWSIVGGADQSKFEISGPTLRWASNGTKDYDAPDDADANNTYVVTVRATDTAGNTTDQTITVTVTEAYEGPAWVAATAGAAGNITFASSGRAAGDELYIVQTSANQALTTPTDFNEVPTVSPQSRGTAAAVGGIRLGVYKKVSDGTEGSVTITNPGNHVYAAGFVVRPASGQSIAIEASAGNTAAASTTHSAGGVTTSEDDCLVINIYGTDRDSAGPSYSGQANASLTNVTERFDAGTTNGVGSGIMISTGEKTAAGSVSATTATSAASVAYAWITLALKNTTGGGGTTLTADAGSFTLTGAAASTLTARKITADAGSFALTGADTNFAKGYAMPASAGAFTLTGAAASLLVDRRITASAGAFTLTGADAFLLKGLTMGGEAASFALNGGAIGAYRGLRLDALAGSFTLDGGNADFLLARLLQANAGSFSLTGADADLSKTSARVLDAETGAFALNGADALLTAALSFLAEAGSFLLAGGDVSLVVTPYTPPGWNPVEPSEASWVAVNANGATWVAQVPADSSWASVDGNTATWVPVPPEGVTWQ